MSFASLGLSEALVRAIEAAGYTQPTPVQQRAIPAVLQGRDLMVAAQTGTGKTGGFALPILERLFPAGHPDKSQRHGPRQPRVLVLTRPANWQPRCMTASRSMPVTCHWSAPAFSAASA